MHSIFNTKNIFPGCNASSPVTFSIPTYKAHFKFNKNLHEATLLVYKWNCWQKSKDSWPFSHIRTKETLVCKYNFICPAPPPNFAIFSELQIVGGTVASWSVMSQGLLSTVVVTLNKFRLLSCRGSYWHWLKLFGTCVRYCLLKLYQVLVKCHIVVNNIYSACATCIQEVINTHWV